MTAPPASATGPAARATRYVASLSHPGVLVLAAALPALFLHVDYQPQASFALGGADVKVTLADVALVAVLVAAVHAGRRLGWEPLSRARAPLVAAVVLLGVVVAWTLLPVALDREYPFAANAVTAAKYVEYALLAPATALLVRRPGDLRPTLVVFVVWAGAAAIGAVLQFVGVLPEPRGYRPGEREPSFLGYHDLGAVAGACLAVALVRVALGSARDRVLTWIALTAGVLGVVLSGALAAFVGISAAALAAGAVARARGALTPRRLGALVAIVAVTGVGVTALRVANIEAFLRFIGVTKSAPDDTFGGESYVQRLALGYIGIRIYRDHPLEGVGWQASSLPWAYDPYLDDARERYPRLPERLLPGQNRDWGVQNAYIQAAADLGVVGALAFLAVYLVPLRRAWRTATRTDVDAEDSAVPLLWLLVTMGIWLGLGIVAGIPTVAVQWLAVGLVVAAAARARADRPAYP